MRAHLFRAFVAALLVVLVLFAPPSSRRANADEGWVITSFSGTYVIQRDGTVDVQEAIEVDFLNLEKHGIFRDIPVRYLYDDDHNRVIEITNVRVTQNDRPAKVERSTNGSNTRLKIGDPNKTVSGRQSYHISYRMKGALNPFDDHDELYLNVTGNGWDVPIRNAKAHVEAPAAIGQVACYQGPTGSTEPCGAVARGQTVDYTANRPLSSGEGITFVAGLPKGAVTVAPPVLEEIKSPAEQARDFLGLYPAQGVATGLTAVLVFAGLLRLWWLKGRDHWYGDAAILSSTAEEMERPLMATETIVPEYAPPPAYAGAGVRPLRPAEVGVLMDERADTLDVSATIVDLAVRGYIRIRDLGSTGLFGMGKHDYELTKLKDAGPELLGYETKLLNALFDTSNSAVIANPPVLAVAGGGDGTAPENLDPGLALVKLSDLKNKFGEDLTEVKSALYTAVSQDDGLFPSNPQTTRLAYAIAGFVMAGIGVGLVMGLGAALGAGLVGIPVVLGGLALVVMSKLMPRRTPKGRESYRRSRGFREFMEVTTDEDRLKFEEEKGIFDKYLPYAIVFGCTEQWAKRFEGLAGETARAGGWYLSPNPFVPMAFASEINSFSSNLSTVIASTPGGSGSSGFGGGSGGGVGGGGGGSW